MATVQNPVIPGFFPDPSVAKVGDTYYLATSSFEYLPGIPIFESRDLVNWAQIGNVATGPEHFTFSPELLASQGVYAPTLRFHDGLFYLIVSITGFGAMDRLPAIFTATDPAGPWSSPVYVTGLKGIDPDIAWDSDGTCYVTVATVGVIRQARVNPATGAILEQPRVMWSGTPNMHAPEAPHLYQIGNWWYLLIAEGGTSRGHAVSIARAKTPYGPFTPLPQNPILTHRGLGLPIQNVGHGDLVEGPDGSWWMVLLGVRQMGEAKQWHPLGRETFLNPVTWLDEWPRTPLVSETIEVPWALEPALDPAYRTDFDEQALDASWISPGRFPADVSDLTVQPDSLTVTAGTGEPMAVDAGKRRFVARRQTSPSFYTRTNIDVSRGIGGITVWYDDLNHYDVLAGNGEVWVRGFVGGFEHFTEPVQIPSHSRQVILRIETYPPIEKVPHMGSDTVVLGFENEAGEFTELSRLDGRYLSAEVAGGFTGRVVGLLAAQGTVSFEWAEFGHL
jgi:beta-xylosidase